MTFEVEWRVSGFFCDITECIEHVRYRAQVGKERHPRD